MQPIDKEIKYNTRHIYVLKPLIILNYIKMIKQNLFIFEGYKIYGYITNNLPPK